MAVRLVSRRVRNSLLGLLKGPVDVAASSAQAAFEVTERSFRGKRRSKQDTPALAQDAVEGAMQAGSQAGAELPTVAKGAVMGVMLGFGSAGKATVGVAADAVRAAVWATGEVGGDIAGVTKRAMEGAIEASRQLGISADDVAEATGASALEAAAGLGDSAVKAVGKVISGTISGVRVVLDAGPATPRLLLVDSNRAELESLSQQLRREHFKTVMAESVKALDHAVRSDGGISAALIDVSGFDDRIWEQCDHLSSAGIPFVVISPQRSPAVLRESMKHGASGVLVKPLATVELVDHIRALLGD